MATKKASTKKLNKAQAIRDYAATHPDSGPTETAKALTSKHGVQFAVAQVSNTLSAKKKVGKKPRGRAGQNGNTNPVELIRAARQFIHSAGGAANATAIIEALGGDEVGNG